ncbi:MAG: alpha/beta fold hydrolase [Planctomycetota bacterium]|nr:alpha/beta fold hydrolase [Planctomycetota bacterium]
MFDSKNLTFACQLSDDVPVTTELLKLSDGLETLVLHHHPGNKTGTPVLYAHGIQSHPGWFTGSAQALGRAGSDVFQITRRGSGTATARRGDAASADQLLDDVDAAVRYVLEATCEERISLLGVSWGGKLLTAYALRSEAVKIDSLTLVAPGLKPQVDVSIATKLAIISALIFRPGTYFDIPLNEVSLFTDNPDMQEYLRNDPHRLHRATARFLYASARLDRIIARAEERALKVPTTLILAGRDRIIDNSATCDLLEWLADRPVRIRRLDAAHTIEFEKEKGAFYDILCQSVMAAG